MTARGDFVLSAGVVEHALDGTAAGDGDITIRFGSAVVSIEGLSALQREHVCARFEALSTRTPAPLRLRVLAAPRDGFRAIDTRGWQNTMALEHSLDAVVIIGLDFAARVEIRGGEAHAATVATWAQGVYCIAPIENTLRILAAYRCLARGGVLLHCVGLVDDGGAHVCFGPSGIGKSTVAAGWLGRGRAILSDELCPIERADDGGDEYLVEQLPFAGDIAARSLPEGRFPLRTLHRLGQGDPSQMDPMQRADAVAALIGCAPFVSIDRHRLPALLASIDALSRACPPTRLTLALGADPRALFTGLRGGA